MTKVSKGGSFVGQGLMFDADGELRYQTACWPQVEDPSLFAVKNLGWIDVVQGRQALDIKLRPRHCSEAALAGLLIWLTEFEGAASPSRVRIWVLQTDGRSFACEFFRKDVCVAAVADWLAEHREDLDHNRSTCIDPAGLASTPTFGPALAAWRGSSGNFADIRRLEEMADRLLGGRYVVLERRSVDGDINLAMVGAGMPTFALTTLRGLIGHPYSLHPDRNYGRSCVSAYRLCMEAKTPMAQHVDAEVKWPRHGLLRRTYTRLLLPITLTSRPSRLLLCATIPVGEYRGAD